MVPSDSDFQDEDISSEDEDIQPSLLDRVGMKMELTITSWFTQWGMTCAKYPLSVMVLSVAFAVGLSTGVYWLKVETDPIELWAAPGSRSRVEKDFFDQTFRPFYRTEQVIVHAKNIAPVIITKKEDIQSVHYRFDQTSSNSSLNIWTRSMRRRHLALYSIRALF